MSFRLQLLAIIFVAFGLPVNAVDTYKAIPFSALNGWQDDDHAAALEARRAPDAPRPSSR